MPATIDLRQVGNVEAAMKRRQRAIGNALENWIVHEIDMEVHDVELVGTQTHLVEHREMRGNLRFELRGVKTDRAIASHDEPGAGARIAARKERHVVAEIDERIGEVCNNSLGAAVESRRYRFDQG
jgi:hypothetical protein